MPQKRVNDGFLRSGNSVWNYQIHEGSQLLRGGFSTSPISAVPLGAGLADLRRVDSVESHQDWSNLECVTVEDSSRALDRHGLRFC